MSFFLYNQDGTQAIARPHLDGIAINAEPGPSSPQPPQKMPRYHVSDSWDAGTNAPSHNFVYDFDRFRFCVNDSWSEVLSHTAHGEVVSGSLQQLIDSFSSGCAIKLSISNLCSDLCLKQDLGRDHEVFVDGGSGYYYTDQKLFIIGSHPLVRVCPSVPLRYASRNWDFGWLMVRSDGHVVYRRCDPYTLQFSDSTSNHAIRWFVR